MERTEKGEHRRRRAMRKSTVKEKRKTERPDVMDRKVHRIPD